MPTIPDDISRGYGFEGWSTSNPTTPHRGDKLDQEYDGIIAALNTLLAAVRVHHNADGTQKNASITGEMIVPGTVTALLTAENGHVNPVAQAWARVAQDWAEYLDGNNPLPPNTLQASGITGNHWSSRWWALQAQLAAAAIAAGGILTGIGPPDPSLGSPGDFYLDTSTFTLYGPKQPPATWPAGVSLVGPQGPAGADGGGGGALPPGGDTGNILVKLSSADGDATWATAIRGGNF